MKAAGVLFYCPDDETILLLRRSDRVSNPGVWSTPGGHIEDFDEDVWSAAVRETLEETRYFPSELSPLFTSVCSSYALFVVAIPLREKRHYQRRLKLNGENDAAKWFDVSYDAQDISSVDVHECLIRPYAALLELTE